MQKRSEQKGSKCSFKIDTFFIPQKRTNKYKRSDNAVKSARRAKSVFKWQDLLDDLWRFPQRPD
jgi:hypothetical protein